MPTNPFEPFDEIESYSQRTSSKNDGSNPDSNKSGRNFVFQLQDDGTLVVKIGGKIVNTFNVRGPKGEKGNQGETGPRGDQGIQGAQGVPGVNGNTWTPVVTDDRQGIYFKNEDGRTTDVYNVKGDRGEKGDPGLPGDKGEKGDQGPAGVNGTNGDTWKPEVSSDGETMIFRNSKGDVVGPFSIKGAQGKQGDQGVQGLPGPKGEQGAVGPKGEDAESWTPVVSEDGESLQFISNKGNKSPIFQIRGPRGYQGVQGIPGIKGEEGKTFTPHYDGEWLWFEDKEGNRPFPPTHVKGDKGDKGERGKSAYELWRDNPLQPENAGKTLDDYLQSLKGEDGKVVNTYHNELSELEDYSCPIHKISPYMIVSTDTLEGPESAEETIELEKARIQGLRIEGEKYANHGSWIQEFFWWCAGADRPLLRMCPGEHSKYMGIGTVIFFTALMAWFSSFVALGLVTGESENPKSTFAIIAPVAILIIGSILTFVGYKRYKLKRLRDHLDNPSDEGIIRSSIQRFNHKIWWIIGIITALCVLLCSIWGKGVSTYISWASLFACAWSLMIFFLDRFITNTMYSDGKVTISWLELRSALPRIIIAIFLGIVISAPLELIIFKNEIKTQVTNDLDAKSNTFKNTKEVDILRLDTIIQNLEVDLRNSNQINSKIIRLKDRITTLETEKAIAVNRAISEVRAHRVNTRHGMTDEERQSATSSANANTVKDKQDAATLASQSYDRRIDSLEDEILSLTDKSDTVVIQRQITERKDQRSDLNKKLEDAVQSYRDSIENNVGLFAQLQALHALAYKDKDGKDDYQPWPKEWYTSWWLWTIGIWLLLTLTSWPFYGNVITNKADEKNNKHQMHKYKYSFSKQWLKGFAVINPWILVIALICGCCNETLFHALPSYMFSAVGMIMMLFILIDISPVFYKMMLADGVYDKLLHKEKLLTEDAIRLNAAKSFAKVNESAIGRLAPFVFGKTAGKLMDMLKEFKSKSSEIDTNKDGRPEMGYGQSQERKDIETTNSEVFSYVLSLKKRLVKVSYLAWYRDMRDHVLATKEDNQNPPGQPEDEFSEFDDDRDPDFSVELDISQLTMRIGETAKLNALVRPQSESTPKVDWQSRDENVAKVSDGEITAISPGITEIIVTCGERFASCNVIVIQSASDEEDYADNDFLPSGDADTDDTQYSNDSSSSETTSNEDSGINIEEGHNDVGQDDDEEHEIKDDETFRDINK